MIACIISGGLIYTTGDVNARGHDNHTALTMATNMNEVRLVELLLARPEILVNAEDYSRLTAICHAARNGNIETTKLLLAHPEININYQA